jgi:MbtH protein
MPTGEDLKGNPFDDEENVFVVLINEQDQRSLWPAATDVPAGWRVEHGPATRRDCLAYVEQNWIDLRPRSLATP